MNNILIGYDLNAQGQDYDQLIDRIKTLGAWWHHLDSTWIVQTNMSATSVRDALKPLLDKNDELLVVNITGDAAAWCGFNQSGSDWLKKHL